MLVDKNITQSNYINHNCVTLRHECNYQMLRLLLPVQLYKGVHYHSSIKHKPVLQIKVTECFKYTTQIELSYLFSFGNSEKITMRIYHDAQVSEIIYCTNLQQFIRLLGVKIKPQVHAQTRNALAVFLQKLLTFLLKSGYNHNHWQLA